MVASINKLLRIGGDIMMFSNRDLEQVCTPHDDALGVTFQIAHAKVSHILVDSGAGVNLLFKNTVKRMRLLNDTTKTRSIMMVFEGALVQTLGTLKLPVVADPYSLIINFHVLDVPSPYNVILGRSLIHIMRVIPSTNHQVI